MIEARLVLTRNLSVLSDEQTALERTLNIVEAELGSYSEEMQRQAAVRLAALAAPVLSDMTNGEMNAVFVAHPELDEVEWTGLSVLANEGTPKPDV